MENSPRLTSIVNAFDLSPAPVAIINSKYHIVWCNREYARIAGIPKSTLLKASVFDLFPADESHQQTLKESFDIALTKGVAHQLRKIEYPVSASRENTKHSARRVYWSVVNTPLLDDDGKAEFIVHQPTDITPFLLGENALDYGAESSQKNLLSQLAHEREYLDSLFQHAPGFVCILRGARHVFELANHAYHELVGRDVLVGKSVAEALPEIVEQGFIEILDNVYHSGKPFVGRAVPVEVKRQGEDELETRYIDFIYQPMFTNNGLCNGIFVQGHDVTEAHQLSLEVAHQANHDPLTSLGNRRELAAKVKQLESDATHALLYIDLDHLKIINDSCGHEAGDAILIEVAKTIVNATNNQHSLVRVGGDEFVVLMQHTTEQHAQSVAEKIRVAVEAIVFVWEAQQYSVSASIGLVEFGGTTTLNFDDAFRLADSACFLAKDKGRNRTQTSRPDDKDVKRHLSDMAWTTRLKDAIREDRITLYGQKIVCIKSPNNCERIEVLARLIDRDGKILSPGLFIPAAERFGLIEQLDRHVLTKAFEMKAKRRTDDKPFINVFVNVSGITLSNPSFVEFLKELTQQYPTVSPTNICIEITERAAVANLGLTTEMMQQIKALGFSFALDDFGSGVATFNYLEQLPINYVKIAGEFVSTMNERAVSLAIVKSIQHISEVMQVETIAESIEEKGLLTALQEMGVNFGQGYGLHLPEPIENI